MNDFLGSKSGSRFQKRMQRQKKNLNFERFWTLELLASTAMPQPMFSPFHLLLASHKTRNPDSSLSVGQRESSFPIYACTS